jgi:hypothetical protein
MEYDRLISEASANISVKVNQKLTSKKKSLFPSFSPMVARFAMPLAAVAAFGFWGYETDFWGAMEKSDAAKHQIISDADFESLFQNSDENAVMNNIVALEHAVLPNEIEHIIPEHKAEAVDEILEEWVFDAEQIPDPNLDRMLEYEIDNIIESEEEFQQIYGES